MQVRWLTFAVALATLAPAPHAAAQGPILVRTHQSGWLGFSYSASGWADDVTIVVDTVIPESPAARAGMQKADTVTDVNGLRATPQLLASLALEPGDQVTLGVRRNGAERNLEITAAERPEGFIHGSIRNNVYVFDTDSIRHMARGMLDSARVHLDNIDFPRTLFLRTPGDSADEMIIVHGYGESVDTIRIDTDSLRTQFRFFSDSMGMVFDSAFDDIEWPDVHFEFEGDSMIVLDSMNMRVLPHARFSIPHDAFRFRAAPFRGVTRVGFNAVGGMALEELSPELGAYFGTDTGLLVLEVGDETPAAEAGLREGDVILRVDGRSTAEIPELRRAIASADGEQIELTVLRERREIELEMAVRD